VLQCVAVCCTGTGAWNTKLTFLTLLARMSESCCSLLQCFAVCCSVLHWHWGVEYQTDILGTAGQDGLQCVAACCSTLQCVAVCSRMYMTGALQHSATHCNTYRYQIFHTRYAMGIHGYILMYSIVSRRSFDMVYFNVLQRVAACCSVIQRVAACRRFRCILSCPADLSAWYASVCCSGLQWVAVGCSALQCVGDIHVFYRVPPIL